MCISTNPSSSLHCRWEPGKELSDNEDVAMKLGLGFTMTANRPSKRRANVVGVDTIRISTRGTVTTRTSSLSRALTQGKPQLVTLVISPHYVPD